MFAYCNNNPVNASDATGNVLKPDSSSTTDEITLFWNAIEYIAGSESGAKLIDLLQKSKQCFIVKITNDKDDGFTVQKDVCVIQWNPTLGLVMSDGMSMQSAAMGLLHELGHAAQYIDNGSYDRLRAKGFNNIEDQGFYVENDNVWRYEIPVAMQLGEPIRLTYDGYTGLSRMSTVTEKVGGSSYSSPFFLRIMDCARSYILQALE